MYQRGGFSLIEILVSISIVTIMLGVGVPAFRNYGRLATFRQTADDIQLAILQAHNLSLAPEADKSASENYYGVQFGQNGSYQVIRCQDKATTTRCAPGTAVVVSSYQMDRYVQFVGDVPAYIGYLVGTGGKPVIPAAPSNTITIHSDQVVDDSLATITLVINPVTGQVTTQ